MLKLLIHFNLVYIGFAIIGMITMLILSIWLGVEPFKLWILLLLLTAIFSGRYYVRTHGDVPSKTVAWKFAFLSVLTSDLIWIPLSIWIWYDAVAKLVSALGWSIVIGIVLIASIARAVLVRFFFVYGAKTHLHKMARKAKVGGSKEALEQTPEDERFGKRIVMLLRLWVPLLLLHSIFSGRYYARTHGDVPSKTVAWKFAFLSLLTSILIGIPLSISIWYDAVVKLDSLFDWSIASGFVLIVYIVYAVSERFFFVYGAKTHLHKMARKAKVSGSKEALEQTSEDVRFGKRIVMLLWGLPVAHGVMAYMVLIVPSIIDAIGLRALVNATAYTWQAETYRALLEVTSAHIAYSIYEIYVLSTISLVIAMVIWLGVVLKEPKLIKRYVLQHEGLNEPYPLKKRTATAIGLFHILVIWAFINMPSIMASNDYRFPASEFGLIFYIFISVGTIMFTLSFPAYCYLYYLQLVKKRYTHTHTLG